MIDTDNNMDDEREDNDDEDNIEGRSCKRAPPKPNQDGYIVEDDDMDHDTRC